MTSIIFSVFSDFFIDPKSSDFLDFFFLILHCIEPFGGNVGEKPGDNASF
jgi:hypothetical protein